MKYSISAGHKKTADAAEIILRDGGNAVDAAIAALTTSFIAEPCMSGAGAGGFAIVRSPDSRNRMYDFFCQTPSTKKFADQTEFTPVEVDFGSAREIFYTGAGSIAVPGTMDGLFQLHDHWGSIPLKELVQPAVLLAREGVRITEFQQYYISLLREILYSSPVGRNIYFDGNELKEAGDTLVMESLADMLETVAIEGRDLFYKGEIAQSAIGKVSGTGHLSMEDFRTYSTVERAPLQRRWNDWIWYSNGPPSLGGGMQWSILNEWTDQLHPDDRSFEAYRMIKDILQRSEQLKQDPQRLFKEYFNLDYTGYNSPQRNKKYGSTTHFNIIDQDGLGIGITISIGEGSGYFIPGTGVQLNNCLGESALLPGGLHSWIPNTRLISLMCPTLLQEQEKDEFLILGTGGAGRIATALSQVLLRFGWENKSLSESVEAPRVHWQDDIFNVERSFFDEETTDLLRSREDVTVWSEPHLYFGGVQASQFTNGDMNAASDSRREGIAIIGD